MPMLPSQVSIVHDPHNDLRSMKKSLLGFKTRKILRSTALLVA